ncbi:MAG: Jag N-terminal domain-containing protein, partial [Oscillospiraceae bacterium]|nr:Jag N-terminal domain-containing protein [Oscillospiraceae bacterium]
MTQIFTAKTVQDAKALAARTFGTEEDKIRFEILEEPKRGLFGMFKGGEAKIKATYQEAIPEEPAPEITESIIEELEEPVKEVPAEDFSTPVEDSVEILPAVPEMTEEISVPAEILQENVNVSEKIPEEIPENSENPENSGSILELISGEASEESLQKIERAKNYLSSVLSAMNIQAT